MSKVFPITPKRTKRINGTILTPEMVVTVTTQSHTITPFYNGAKEVQEAYMRLYNFDYKKACCSANDFEFKKLSKASISYFADEDILHQLTQYIFIGS